MVSALNLGIITKDTDEFGAEQKGLEFANQLNLSTYFRV
jgi:hypothetical protein